MSENPDGPPLLRPIPRRPFNLNLTGPTPPDENADSPVSQQAPSQPHNSSPGTLNLDSLNRRLLDPRNGTPSRFDNTGSENISRAQSFLNLTSSTLFGIYAESPSSSTFSPGYGVDGGSLRDRRFFVDPDESNTPWGTGAETPAKRLSVDEPYYDVHRERAGLVPARGRTRRRSSALQSASSGGVRRAPPPSRPAAALYMGLRGLLLFGLGILYGALVARFQDDDGRHHGGGGGGGSKVPLVGKVQSSGGSAAATTYDTSYMAFWGVSGVALGALLPWFDGVWEGIFGPRDEDDIITGGSADEGEDDQGIDWALVVRGVGAFVGIVFAIRRLEWTSTLQVSLALALVNPFLWYLIDRSKPGLLLAAAVGVGGSAVLMGLRSDMVPTPAASYSWSSSSDPSYDFTGNLTSTPGDSSSRSPPMVLGGLASQETVENGMWTLSILFCCCVFFGNIGRRLALNRSGRTKGRWAERKDG